MQLIRRIEINYLRSLYKATIEDPGDINVIFGRNDSGKSNVLRALNLFFNDEISPNQEIDFSLDFSDVRREQARIAKGKQFISIRVDFNIPTNYRKSLGAQVSIKRQWNIDGAMSETLPRDMKRGAKIQLSRFLNQIDFTYIPAIKDLSVFGDLIERMYAAAAESKGLQGASDAFVEAIRAQTSELSDGLSLLFGATTRLAAPTEMSQLFRSLDFAHGDDGHSLLRQKGDGVKARHLPELLRYINANEAGKKYFIWGFEEPENSLDLGAADSEAQNFAKIGSRSDTQVFITSHSPAFYLSNADSRRTTVRRIFVSKQTAETGTDQVSPRNAVSVIDRLEEAEARMKEASLLQLPYLIRRWGEMAADRDRYAAEAARLNEQLNSLRLPTLFVEGKTDRLILETALARIGIERGTVSVKTLEGTPKTATELLRRLSTTGGLHNEAPILFLFDNDKPGRLAFQTICGNRPTAGERVSLSDKIGVWVLPQTEENKAFCRQFGIRPENLFFPIEFLFPAVTAAIICTELLTAERQEQTRGEIHQSYHDGITQAGAWPLRSAEPGTADWLWARGVPDDIKTLFARRALDELDLTVLDNLARDIALN